MEIGEDYPAHPPNATAANKYCPHQGFAPGLPDGTSGVTGKRLGLRVPDPSPADSARCYYDSRRRHSGPPPSMRSGPPEVIACMRLWRPPGFPFSSQAFANLPDHRIGARSRQPFQ